MQAEGLSQFLLRMLRFHPESRATAEELLNDPWLQGKLPEAPAELTDLASRKRRRPSNNAEEKQPPPTEPATATAASAAADTARAAPDAARVAPPQHQPTTAHAGAAAPVRPMSTPEPCPACILIQALSEFLAHCLYSLPQLHSASVS